MRAPPVPRWLAIALVVCAGMGGVGAGFWWTAPDLAMDANVDGTVSSEYKEWWRVERWMSREEIEQRVHGSTPAELERIFDGEDASWMQTVNGTETLRMALHRLAATGDPAVLASRAFHWVWRSKLTKAARANSLGLMAEVLVENAALKPVALAKLVHGKPLNEIQSVLEACLRGRRQASPEEAAAVGAQFLIEAGLAEKEALAIAQSVAVVVWFEEDPAAAIQFCAALGQAPVVPRALRQALAIDRARGIELLRLVCESRVPPEQIGNAAYQIGNAAFQAGFTAAQLREALSGKPVQELYEYLTEFGPRTLFEAPTELPDLAKAFSAAEVFAPWQHGTMVLARGVLAIPSGLADRDPDATRAWLAGLSPEHRLFVLRGAWQFEGLGNARFAEICVEEPNFFADTHSARSVFNALADGRLEVGLRALPLLPEGKRDERELEMRCLNTRLEFHGRLADAMNGIETAPERLRWRLRQFTFELLADSDPEQARQWLEHHPEHRSELMLQLANRSPFLPDSERERLIQAQLAGPRGRGGLQESVDFFAHYGNVNPARGIAWLESLPPESHPGERFAAVFVPGWAAHDPDKAGAWVEGLPPGAFRDVAAAQMMRALRHDPDRAIKFAESITNPESRHQAYKELIQGWAKADASVAARLIDDGPMAEADRSELRALLERPVPRGGTAP